MVRKLIEKKSDSLISTYQRNEHGNALIGDAEAETKLSRSVVNEAERVCSMARWLPVLRRRHDLQPLPEMLADRAAGYWVFQQPDGAVQPPCHLIHLPMGHELRRF